MKLPAAAAVSMIVFIGASPRGMSGVSVSWAGSVRAIRRARTEIVNFPISAPDAYAGVVTQHGQALRSAMVAAIKSGREW